MRQGPDSILQQIAADFAVPEQLAVQLARNALDNCLTVDGVYWGVRLALSLASGKGELASVQDIADRCGCTVGEALRLGPVQTQVFTGFLVGRREKGTATPHRLVMHRRASGKVSNAPSKHFWKN